MAIARITDGVLMIAGEIAKTEKDLYTPAYIIQTAGLALLMIAPLGFIGLVYVFSSIPSYLTQVTISGQRVFSDIPRASHMLRLLGFLAVVALVFAIAGGLLACGSDSGQHWIYPEKSRCWHICRVVSSHRLCAFWCLFLPMARKIKASKSEFETSDS